MIPFCTALVNVWTIITIAAVRLPWSLLVSFILALVKFVDFLIHCCPIIGQVWWTSSWWTAFLRIYIRSHLSRHILWARCLLARIFFGFFMFGFSYGWSLNLRLSALGLLDHVKLFWWLRYQETVEPKAKLLNLQFCCQSRMSILDMKCSQVVMLEFLLASMTLVKGSFMFVPQIWDLHD